MSKARAAGPAGRQGESQEKTRDETAPVLAPRKGLFVVLMIALAVWVGVLVVLYLTTVKRPTTRASWIMGAVAREAARA